MLTDEQKQLREQSALILKCRVDRFLRWQKMPYAPEPCLGTEIRLIRKALDDYASTLGEYGIKAMNEPDKKYNFKECERCDGRGEWESYDPATDSHSVVECPDCEGTGAVDADE